ncbi:PST family polysaccharide transporter [Yoonia maricola]|uniref:PST family polysaccharide transporter n=1 Tax=Yoonia maricola TaxID=420999 RepID=A0A2M8WP41_9RHOB|nr:lipopolysaccharide biosynthesis protein [Yoonia maricola]PJI92674.1 PST family polysaccharide transporter [Yoonia maricola]
MTAPKDKPEGPSKPLTGSTIGHFLWMFGGGGAESILKIVVLLVLARLLMPVEFGLVGAALTVVALAEVAGRIGVAPSIIQAKILTRDHIATGMTTTLMMGVLMAALVFGLSELIARLYRMPDLTPFIQTFALLFIIKGAGMVSEALMQRALRFREIALMRVFSYLFGYAAVAVTLSVLGFGAWSLVLGQLVQQTLITCFYLYSARDDLAIGFRWSSFTSMIEFGFGITLTQIGNYLAQNADYFIIGRWLGPEALGYYSRAYLLLRQGAQLVGKMGDQVLFPTLASIQDDKPRLQRALNRALSLVAMTQIPLTALLVVAAPEIILVLMGPQWGPAILPFQILVAVLFFRTAYQFVGAILRAAGRVYIAALWQWSYAAMVVVGSYLGQPLGLWGVAVGVSVATVICHLMGLLLVRHFIGLGTGASFSRMLHYSVLGMMIGAALFAAKAWLLSVGVGGALLLVTLVAGFVATYAGFFFATPRIFGEEGTVLSEQVVKRLFKRSRRSDKS